MQSANLFGAPLGVSSVICPSRATQASGLAGGPDLLPVNGCVCQNVFERIVTFPHIPLTELDYCDSIDYGNSLWEGFL